MLKRRTSNATSSTFGRVQIPSPFQVDQGETISFAGTITSFKVSCSLLAGKALIEVYEWKKKALTA